MPKRRRKTPARRRLFSRRKRRRRSLISRLPSVLVPASKTVRLRYCENVQLNASSSGPAAFEWRANSIYDPNLTGVGHQPLGRDQWSEYYDHYMVIGAKITAEFHSQSTGSNNAHHVGLALWDAPAQADADYQTCRERNMDKLRFMGQANNSRGYVKMTKYYSPRKFFGIKDIGDNQTRLGAAIGNNPTEDAIFAILHYSPSPVQTIDPGAIGVTVIIEYIVKFTERKKILSS